MSSETPELRILREGLEALLSPAEAAAILQEALGGRTVAPGAGPVRVLLEGAVQEILAEHLGDGGARDAVARIRTDLERTRRGQRERDDPTRNIEVGSEPLPLLILSSSPDLAVALNQTLTSEEIAIASAGDEDTMRARIAHRPPRCVLVDGGSFPRVEPTTLAAILAALPHTTLLALWGADLPYGLAVLAAAQGRALEVTSLDRREGLNPVLDLLRARRS